MVRRSQWSVPISKIMDEIKADHRRIAVGTALEAFGRLIIRSPVDTGRFKGNWMIAADNEPEGYDVNKFDKNGASTLGAASALQFQLGQTIKIRNNLPYAVPLEYGHSQQAPSGLVRITSSELPQIVKNVGAGLAAKGS